MDNVRNTTSTLRYLIGSYCGISFASYQFYELHAIALGRFLVTKVFYLSVEIWAQERNSGFCHAIAGYEWWSFATEGCSVQVAFRLSYRGAHNRNLLLVASMYMKGAENKVSDRYQLSAKIKFSTDHQVEIIPTYRLFVSFSIFKLQIPHKQFTGFLCKTADKSWHIPCCFPLAINHHIRQACPATQSRSGTESPQSLARVEERRDKDLYWFSAESII